MTMTKADIVERIYERVGFSKKEATEVVESIFELVKRHLERGEKVKVSGFGNFVVNEKRPRKGRNPQTGEEIVISGRRVLTFKASQVLKKTMNGGPPARSGHDAREPGRERDRPPRQALLQDRRGGAPGRRQALCAALLGERVRRAPARQAPLPASSLPPQGRRDA